MTIKDLAKHCGVSVSTVSRVLNNKPDVSEAVRETVQRAVEELHYVPNSTARELVMPASDAVGLVARGDSNQFYTEIISNIEHSLRLAGYSLVIETLKHGEDELWAGAALARSKRLRGLIFLGGCFDYSEENAARLGVPFVCCTYTNSFGTLEEGEYASVSIDDQKTAFDAVEHLIHCGHREIAALVPHRNDRSISELRYNGYRAALFSNDIPYSEELVAETGGSYDMDPAYRGTVELLERKVPFTALFTLSDTMAFAAMKALWEHGVKVPEDCSVVAIDGLNMSEYFVPTLTTMVQPEEELARESVALLMDTVLRGRGPRHITLEAALRPGGSVKKI